MSTTEVASVLPDQPRTAREAAQQYIRRGWAVTPLIGGQKAARLPDWTKTDIAFDDIDRHFETTDGVGIRTGEPSNWLVDIDLDSPLALRVARHEGMLPRTSLIAGRAAKPSSHRLYQTDGDTPHETFRGVAVPGVIVEVLSTGQQMAAPPGSVDKGDGKRWFAFGEPGRVRADDLLRYVAELAATVELLAVWPAQGNGVRHAAYLALAGALLNADVETDRIELITEVLIAETGDPEPDDRRRAVADTLAKDDGGPTTGWPTLRELTGATESIEAILGWLGVTGVDLNDTRPAVRIYDGDLDRLSAKAWEALAEANDPPTLFRRSNAPVRVERIDAGSTVIIRELDDTRLRHHAADKVRWFRRGDKGDTPAKPPVDVIRDMRANPNIPLPVLNRVVTVPVFAPDGTLQTEAGYHGAARVFYEPPEGLTIPTVAEQPSQDDVDRARTLLLDLVAEFPFVSESDRAHALALAFLPFVRDLIDGPTPLHLFEAGKPGTGKGLLVRTMTSLFAGGTGADETPMPGVEEEVRKKLFALLSEGAPFIYFDNINQRVDSESLASALTSLVYRDRRLGVSETGYMPVRCAWIGSANNPVMSNELARRTVRCRLVADVEFPHLRVGWRHPDLSAHVARHRGELVWAVLTHVRAWLVAGRPDGTRLLGSYEAYSRIVGGLLASAGIGGFLDNIEDFYAEADDEGASMRTFVATWWEQFGPERQTPTALLPVAESSGIVFEQWKDDKRRAELGLLLRKQTDNVYGGIAIRRTKAPRGASSAYRLEPKEGQEWSPPVDLGSLIVLPGHAPDSVFGGGAGGYSDSQGVPDVAPENNGRTNDSSRDNGEKPLLLPAIPCMLGEELPPSSISNPFRPSRDDNTEG